MELASPVSRISSRRGAVIQVAGPRGWGMWWLDNSETTSLRPMVSLDRLSWRDRQEHELSRAVRGILLGMFLLDGLDLEVWESGLGDTMLELVSRIRDPYPPASWDNWEGVPGLWVCDPALESDLHQGVGPGCPGAGYDDALEDAWFGVGAMVDRLEGIGRYLRYMDGMSSADLHESNALATLSYEVLDLARDTRRFEGLAGPSPASLQGMGSPHLGGSHRGALAVRLLSLFLFPVLLFIGLFLPVRCGGAFRAGLSPGDRHTAADGGAGVTAHAGGSPDPGG